MKIVNARTVNAKKDIFFNCCCCSSLIVFQAKDTFWGVFPDERCHQAAIRCLACKFLNKIPNYKATEELFSQCKYEEPKPYQYLPLYHLCFHVVSMFFLLTWLIFRKVSTSASKANSV